MAEFELAEELREARAANVDLGAELGRAEQAACDARAQRDELLKALKRVLTSGAIQATDASQAAVLDAFDAVHAVQGKPA